MIKNLCILTVLTVLAAHFSVNGQVLETIYHGDIFGEGALVHTDSKRASTAIAKTDCKLAIMERRNFLFAVQQTPMFALEIMRSYSDRVRRLRESVSS